MSRVYDRSSYNMTMIDGVDRLTIQKAAGSDWSYIKMEVNGVVTEIALRSQKAAEALLFMLEQMLRGES